MKPQEHDESAYRVGGEQDTDLLASQAVAAMLDELRAFGLTDDEIRSKIEEEWDA